MSDPETNPSSVAQSPDFSPGQGETAGPGQPPPASPIGTGSGRLILLAMAAGLLAGLSAALLWEAVGASFAPRGSTVKILGTQQTIVTVQGRIAAGIRGGAMRASMLGGILGLALGIAGGLVRQEMLRGLVAGLVGATLGALGGFASARGLLPLFYRHESPISGDLILPLLTQGGVWCTVGAAGGIAFALGLAGKSPQALLAGGIGGLLGAAIGAIGFEAVGAFSFPNDETDQPISSSWITRLLAYLMVALFTSAGAAIGLQDRGARNRPPRVHR